MLMKDDSREYVRRWKKPASPEREWIIRHATRTLVKAGHPDVFGLLGYTENPRVQIQSLDVSPKQIRLGEALEFTVVLKSKATEPQKMVVDYAVHHMKANGQTSPKVFKLRSVEIAPGATVELAKRHTIKPVTTRKYHPGKHAIETLVNGKSFGQVGFILCANRT